MPVERARGRERRARPRDRRGHGPRRAEPGARRPRRVGARPRARVAGGARRARRRPRRAHRERRRDRASTSARRFGSVLVPMQTVQLLAGPGERAGLLRGVRRHLEPGGLVAFALADELEHFHGDFSGLPAPDVGHRAGWRLVSQPVAVQPAGAVTRIERVRELRLARRRAVLRARRRRARPRSTPPRSRPRRAAGLDPAPRRRSPRPRSTSRSAVVVLRG